MVAFFGSSSANKQQPQMIQVLAPCAMEGGFTFLASYNDKPFPVVVPPGGVKQGELFTVPYSNSDAAVSEVTPFFVNNGGSADAPPGHWNDELWDCCRFGPFHPTFWNALCCPQILMAQILTRFKLNWLGERGSDQEWRQTFPRILSLVCLYWALTIFLAPRNSDTSPPPPGIQVFLYNSVSWVFGIYTLLVLTKLRRMIRMRHEIPTVMIHGDMWILNEDCCISFWCGCCSVAQMARQTCNYEHQAASCCSPTGIGPPPYESHLSVLTV